GCVALNPRVISLEINPIDDFIPQAITPAAHPTNALRMKIRGLSGMRRLVSLIVREKNDVSLRDDVDCCGGVIVLAFVCSGYA
ncbi:MAG: hypothetical protein K2L85_03695, partial [Paramuribaculum sp.]|nr:hypothetical protein [Paramuribaculum sp.]